MTSEEGLFDETTSFQPDEVRQYLFLLQPVSSKFRIDNSVEHRLGSVLISWRNYLGDVGALELDKVKSVASSSQSRAEAR